MRPHLSPGSPASFLLWLSGFAVACRSSPPSEAQRAPVPSASARSLDRLAPGELAPGSGQIFGLVVPRNMSVKAKHVESAYVEGNVAPEALANYVKDRVAIERVEVGAARTVFPSAVIKQGDLARRYDIEVVAGNGRPTALIVRDVTPHGPSGPPEMTEAERWRQAGRTPDGRPLDIATLR
jgi:hypothetical protein